jgi:hypothetical protein
LATQQQIDLVKMNLPSWWSTLADWDDAKVIAVIDAYNGNVNQSIRQFWYDRVAYTQPLVDSSESGGSAPLSQDHESAERMLKYWDQQIAQSSTSGTIKIKRRYRRCRGNVIVPDIYGYGSPYARTD